MSKNKLIIALIITFTVGIVVGGTLGAYTDMSKWGKANWGEGGGWGGGQEGTGEPCTVDEDCYWHEVGSLSCINNVCTPDTHPEENLLPWEESWEGFGYHAPGDFGEAVQKSGLGVKAGSLIIK